MRNQTKWDKPLTQEDVNKLDENTANNYKNWLRKYNDNRLITYTLVFGFGIILLIALLVNRQSFTSWGKVLAIASVFAWAGIAWVVNLKILKNVWARNVILAFAIGFAILLLGTEPVDERGRKYQPGQEQTE